MDDIVTDQNLRSVLQISQDARDQALALVDLIAQQQQQQQNGAGDDGAAHVALAKLQKQLMTNLSHLRGLHRAAFIAARDTKAMTAEKRQEVDTLHLQLQNLYYEQRHLEGEIAACEGYE